MLDVPEWVDDEREGIIYLLHFHPPHNPQERGYLCHASHYIGQTSLELHERLARHRAGHGSKMLRAANKLGLAYSPVRTWRGTQRDEWRLKKKRAAFRLCPLCAARPLPALDFAEREFEHPDLLLPAGSPDYAVA